jgi:uncharacterized protein (UPF0276 family)
MRHLSELPRLGVGISCEFGGGPRGQGLDALALREALPGCVHFLEVGADLSRGLDEHMLRWAAAGLPTTYHFLDLNLAERQDMDAAWLTGTLEQLEAVGAAWICGDAGYWHLGRRERGHELLLPPIFSPSAAEEMAGAITALQDAVGKVVLPENPPAAAFVGPLHLLDFFGRVVTQADCGLLLDAAHLAVYQMQQGLDPLTGLDDFPLDRIVEIHVAGGTVRDHQGLMWVEDDHGPQPLPETWAIVEHVLKHAPNLKAVLYECEHNLASEVAPLFGALNEAFPLEAP